MIYAISNLVMKMRLKDLLKRNASQSKGIGKTFRSMLVVLSEEEGYEIKHLSTLADRLKIASKNITVVVLTKKENIETQSAFKNTFVISRKSIGIFGKIPPFVTQLFEKSFDLQLNFFNKRSVFLEFFSASFKSKLRTGFYKSNHEMNDLILDIDPHEKEVFLNETTTYLNALLKK
jgi:hypothetical protein